MESNDASLNVRKTIHQAESFNYESLLKLLRDLRIQESREREVELQRQEMSAKHEARHHFRLFEKEFVKGKGMKNGGYGGIIVGKHYQKIHQQEQDQIDKEKYDRWLRSVEKRNAQIKRRRMMKEQEAKQRRMMMNMMREQVAR